jgi:6-phosphofructokinase 1
MRSAVSVAHSLGVGRFGPGGFDLEKILGGVEKAGYNQVFVIGGDGTHKGAHCLTEEIRHAASLWCIGLTIDVWRCRRACCSKRKLKISVVAIPKTIDNDIALIDRSFGFETAVAVLNRSCSDSNLELTSASGRCRKPKRQFAAPPSKPIVLLMACVSYS